MNNQLTINSLEHIKKYNQFDKNELKSYSKLLKYPAFIQGLELDILKFVISYLLCFTLISLEGKHSFCVLGRARMLCTGQTTQGQTTEGQTTNGKKHDKG